MVLSSDNPAGLSWVVRFMSLGLSTQPPFQVSAVDCRFLINFLQVGEVVVAR